MSALKHLDEIDYLRGFAVISVLAWHTHVLDYLEVGNDYNFESLLIFGVPTFIFISGLVLTYVYRKGKINNATAIKSFYARRISFTFIPYVIWAFIYSLIVNNPRPTDVISFFSQFIINTLTGNLLFLWFIVIAFQFYILFPLILKLFDGYRKHHVITILALLLTLGIYVMFPAVDRRFLVPWLFYFVLGMSVGYSWETATVFLKKHAMKLCVSIIWVALFVATPIALIGVYETYFTPYILVYASLTAIFLMISVKPNTVYLKIFKIAGIYSYGIYLSHVPIMRFWSFVLRTVNVVRTPILYFFLTFVTSTVFTFLVRKLPFGKFVVGR